MSASAAVRAVDVPPRIALEVEVFARERGGVVAGPFPLPYRSRKAKSLPSFVFFVGGSHDRAARSAWVATLGAVSEYSAFTRRMELRLPDITRSETAGEEVLIEPVAYWPKAVRVLDAAPMEDATAVIVESLAARDRPEGLRGVLWLAEGSGGRMTAESNTFERGDARRILPSDDPAALLERAKISPSPIDPRAATAFVRSITSGPALANAISAEGASVVETWQRSSLARHIAHVERGSLAASPELPRALRALEGASCDRFGSCSSDAGGVVLDETDAGLVITAILLPAAPVPPLPERPPTPAVGDDTLTFRAFHAQPGPLRPLARADVGDGRIVSVASHERVVYLVQEEGAYASVEPILELLPDATASARIVDVDGDGVSDVVAFSSTRAVGNDPFARLTVSTVVLRTHEIEVDSRTDPLGFDIELLRAVDLDDAVTRALAHPHRATITVGAEEACKLLRASTTPAAFQRAAAPDARVLWFREPRSPARAHRAVPAGNVTREDLALVPEICVTSSRDDEFTCEGDLCGNLLYALGSYVRFTRVGGDLRFDTVLIYSGS